MGRNRCEWCDGPDGRNCACWDEHRCEFCRKQCELCACGGCEFCCAYKVDYCPIRDNGEDYNADGERKDDNGKITRRPA